LSFGSGPDFRILESAPRSAGTAAARSGLGVGLTIGAGGCTWRAIPEVRAIATPSGASSTARRGRRRRAGRGLGFLAGFLT
jgi:hypothetical protein